MKRLIVILLIVGLAAVALLTGCSSDQSFESLLGKGKEAFFDGKFAEARDYLNKAITLKPSDLETLQLLSRAYRRDYMYDSALFFLGRADKLYPKDRVTNQQIYEVARALQDWERVIEAINVLAKSGDGYDKYNLELSDLWGKLEYNYNCWYWADQALQRDTNNIDLYIVTANAALRTDSVGIALEVINRAIDKFGQQPMLMANKAIYLAGEGKDEEAERILRPLIAEDSTRLEFKLSLAHVLSAQDSRAKKREALALYNSLKGRVPPDLGLDSSLARLEAELNGTTPGDK